MNEYKYALAYSAAFKSDFKSLNNDEKRETKVAMEKPAKGEPLEAKYKDHALHGRLQGFRNCHIRPDLVLVYRIQENILELYIYRVGSHSKLYGK